MNTAVLSMLTHSHLHMQNISNGQRNLVNSKAVNDDNVDNDCRLCDEDRVYSCCPNSDSSEGWWVETFGPFLTSIFSTPILDDDSCRVFRGGIARFAAENDAWDLSDSLVELYETEQRHEVLRSLLSGSSATSVPRIGSAKSWLNADRANGFIRVFSPDSLGPSQLVPCSLSTTTHRLCLQLQISNEALHVQFCNGFVQRLEPQSYPLGIQNDFLANLGHSDIASIQEEGSSEDLQHLIKFFSGNINQWRKLASLQPSVRATELYLYVALKWQISL